MPTHICFNNRPYLYGLLNSKNNVIVKALPYVKLYIIFICLP